MNAQSVRAKRRVVVVDESALAKRIGQRIREARARSGLSQRELAGERFTGQYVSGLERGAVKPSMAALNYLAQRLGVSVADLLDPRTEPWSRVEADIKLASGDLNGATDRYQTLLASAPTATAKGQALLGLAESLCRRNLARDAIRHASEAVELFEKANRPVDAAWAAYWLASAQFQTDNGSEARALLENLLSRVRGGLEMEPGFKLRLLTSLAAVMGWAGQHDVALSYLEEGRDLIEALDPRVQAAYFYSLAQNYKQAGDLEAAVRAGARSLTLYEGLGSKLEVSVLHNHLALTYLKLGNTKQASEFAGMAATEAETLSDPRSRAWVAETQAAIALARGEFDEAIGLADRALGLESAGASPQTVMSALLTAANAHRAAGHLEDARSYYQRAAEAAKSDGGTVRRREVLAAFADFLTDIGDEKAALAMYREAVR